MARIRDGADCGVLAIAYALDICSRDHAATPFLSLV